MEKLATVIHSCGEKLTKKPQDSERRTAVFSDFAVRFAANYGEPLGEARRALFLAELQDVDADTLGKALTWVLNNCKRFGAYTPCLADIREGVRAVKKAETVHDYLLQSEAPPLLPGPTWDELCARGEEYRKSIKSLPLPEPKLKPEYPLCIATPERRAVLQEQAKKMLAKYPMQIERRFTERLVARRAF